MTAYCFWPDFLLPIRDVSGMFTRNTDAGTDVISCIKKEEVRNV